MRSSKYWIDKLNLVSHPEGGYFKDVYRSDESLKAASLPSRFLGDRSFSTAIYFLLEKGQKSAFHRIKSDELWHFYDGDPVIIYIIDQKGSLSTLKLGLNFNKGYSPQIVIPANCWFAAETEGNFTLSGCTVAPGFNFDDFELAARNKLSEEFPQHKVLINKFT